VEELYNYNLGNCGMSFQGAINRVYLKFLKQAIEKDSKPSSSQNPPTYRITWECSSDTEAVEHGYPKGYWDRLSAKGATIVKIEETGWGLHAVTDGFVAGLLSNDVKFIDKIDKIENESVRGLFITQCLKDEREYKKEIPTLDWNKARRDHLEKLCRSISKLKKKFPQHETDPMLTL
jgi:hypothetical protein